MRFSSSQVIRFSSFPQNNNNPWIKMHVVGLCFVGDLRNIGFGLPENNLAKDDLLTE